MFSYFRDSHWRVVRVRWCPYVPYVHRPHIFGYHPYVQQILIGYLFCYLIKCFPTLETVRGGCQTVGGVHMPPMFIDPIHLDTPNIFREFE